VRLPAEGRGKQEGTMRAVTTNGLDYGRKNKDHVGVVMRSEKPIDGRILVLGMREVNLRGASLFPRTKGKEGKHE
jgi:hypothetical protein